MADSFTSDIHRYVTDVHDPRLQRHFALIGRIPLMWSEIEFSIGQVMVAYNRGSEHSKEQLWFALARLGNRDRPDVLAVMNRHTSLGQAGDACVAFAIKAYRTLNQNRNQILHAHTVDFDKASEIVWARFSTSDKTEPAFTHMTLRELTFQVRSFERLRNYLFLLFREVWAANNPDCLPPRWPRKFPEPRLLPTIQPGAGIPKKSPRAQRQRHKRPASPRS